ncbi:unnamed protein product [Rotaria sp. Silwood2]|nr:unnamed protein product [Rotaria sp. Silwood2]CAF3153756.1 unnamed protein product [Rotaria sp. Silwood2]CAF4585424.1 unnamed protein product [Rotaria sp. Silwood2]CAF4589007.1 unnamed protein product [Rotaria sp. Silwood2]
MSCLYYQLFNEAFTSFVFQVYDIIYLILAPISCFIAGTPILLADGKSTIAVEQARINMTLFGVNGEINRVIALRSQVLNGRSLYGMNGERPFVTPDHPFMSPYNSSVRLVFDAKYVRHGRPDLKPDTIQQIEVGTKLVRYNSTSGQFDIVRVNSIVTDEYPSVNTSIYHFVTDSPSGVLGK